MDSCVDQTLRCLVQSWEDKPHPIQVNQGGLAKVIDGIGALQIKELTYLAD